MKKGSIMHLSIVFFYCCCSLARFWKHNISVQTGCYHCAAEYYSQSSLKSFSELNKIVKKNRESGRQINYSSCSKFVAAHMTNSLSHREVPNLHVQRLKGNRHLGDKVFIASVIMFCI